MPSVPPVIDILNADINACVGAARKVFKVLGTASPKHRQVVVAGSGFGGRVDVSANGLVRLRVPMPMRLRAFRVTSRLRMASAPAGKGIVSSFWLGGAVAAKRQRSRGRERNQTFADSRKPRCHDNGGGVAGSYSRDGGGAGRCQRRRGRSRRNPDRRR
jgi:hypothetical protein